jgi:cell division protein FtsB
MAKTSHMQQEKKIEKKKLLKKSKESSKKHREIEELKKTNRKLEQEFERLRNGTSFLTKTIKIPKSF